MNQKLSEMEKAGISTLLRKMTIEDLMALTFTTTKGYVKPEDKEDAIQAVIMYCENPSILLRRKKIKRELLFQYLREYGVQVSINGDKRDLIDACLKFWGSIDEVREEFECKPLGRPGLRENDVKPNIIEENFDQAKNLKANEMPCQQPHSVHRNNQENGVKPNFAQQIEQPTVQQPAPVQITEIVEEPNPFDNNNQEIVPYVQNLPQEPVISIPPNTNVYNFASQVTNTNNQGQFPTAFNEFHEYSIVVTESPPCDKISELGKTFVEWFYKTLNGDLPHSPNHCLQQDNFWPDCSIEVYTEGNDHNYKSACIQGAANILMFFKGVLNDNRLYMVPSMESIQTNYNSHGVVKVMVNGVMHQIPITAGLFEHIFILIQDPISNNVWRIKNTMLRMRLNCPLSSFLQSQQVLKNMVFN